MTIKKPRKMPHRADQRQARLIAYLEGLLASDAATPAEKSQAVDKLTELFLVQAEHKNAALTRTFKLKLAELRAKPQPLDLVAEKARVLAEIQAERRQA